jgi:hypothetical protein
MTAIDNKVEPKSSCSKFSIYFSKLHKCNSTLINYLFKIKSSTFRFIKKFFY